MSTTYFQFLVDGTLAYESGVGVSIDRESALDGIYIVRTDVPEAQISATGTVEAYKSLSAVERAFRSLKSVDLNVRPIHHG